MIPPPFSAATASHPNKGDYTMSKKIILITGAPGGFGRLSAKRSPGPVTRSTPRCARPGATTSGCRRSAIDTPAASRRLASASEQTSAPARHDRDLTVERVGAAGTQARQRGVEGERV